MIFFSLKQKKNEKKIINEFCVRIFKLKVHSVESETMSEICFFQGIQPLGSKSNNNK